MEFRPLACPQEAEPEKPDSLERSVLRLIRLRHVVAAGLSVAAWLVIGSASAMAADVSQSNSNSNGTAVVAPQGISVAGLGVAGPVTAPLTTQLGTNLNGTNVNAAGNQNNSGNSIGNGPVSQENTNKNRTLVVAPQGVSVAGTGVAGPVTVPITVADQLNANCTNVNVAGNQNNSGNCIDSGPVSQENKNSNVTAVVAPQGISVAGAGVAGPVTAPITAAVQANLNCTNVNLAGNQNNSGNCIDSGPVSQENENSNRTFVFAPQGVAVVTTAGVAGPVTLPITAAVQPNANCTNVNALGANQNNSGNCIGSGDDTGDSSSSSSTPESSSSSSSSPSSSTPEGSSSSSSSPSSTMPASSSSAGSTPVLRDVMPRVQQDPAGGVDQENDNASRTAVVSPQGVAVTPAGVAGPVTAPITPAVQLNADCTTANAAAANANNSGNCIGALRRREGEEENGHEKGVRSSSFSNSESSSLSSSRSSSESNPTIIINNTSSSESENRNRNANTASSTSSAAAFSGMTSPGMPNAGVPQAGRAPIGALVALFIVLAALGTLAAAIRSRLTS